MPSHTIGIDPGLTGACAILDTTTGTTVLHDTPIITMKLGRAKKNEYDLPAMAALLRPYAGANVHAVIEESQPMPGQGVKSMFTIGLGFGVWLAMLAALEIPYERVRPIVWKRALKLPGKDKEAARLRAQQLYPSAELSLKKHHGRAEALLLAHWGNQPGQLALTG